MKAAAIINAGNLVLTLGPIALDLAMKIKALLAPLGPDVTVNIMALGDDAITADEDTTKRVNDWLVANNIPLA